MVKLLTYENSQIRPVHHQMQTRDRVGLPSAMRRTFAVTRHVMFSTIAAVNNVPSDDVSLRVGRVLSCRVLVFGVVS